MTKKLDLNKSVYELVTEYPELVDILKDLGFTDITKKGMLHSMGKMVTIPKGAKMKNISMMEVAVTLMSKGFELTGEMPTIQMGAAKEQEDQPTNSRKNKLKSI